jgi:hypothetical protein
MLRHFIASALAACCLAAGLHTSIVAAPPIYLECRDTLLQPTPILVVIANHGEGKLRDAVRHCLETLGGHPTGAER